jgi:DNA-binding LytR/AlgR family response regulator
MIRAIALDDEPPALQVISAFCSLLDFIDLQKTFSKTEDAYLYLKKNPVDLIFLDINMPSISGIRFYKEIKQQTMVIFTTAHSEYAIEGFNLHAIDYLLKPFTQQRFIEAATKAKQYYDFLHHPEGLEQLFILVRADYSLIKVMVADILFVEALDDYLKIRLKGQKPLIARLTMKALLEKLPAIGFTRVHRSYIVSLAHIEKVRNKMIMIAGEEIPLSSSYESSFFTKFNG